MKGHGQLVNDGMVSVRCHDRYLFLAAGYGEYSSHSVEDAAAGAGGKVPIVVKCNRGCGRSICAGGGSAFRIGRCGCSF